MIRQKSGPRYQLSHTFRTLSSLLSGGSYFSGAFEIFRRLFIYVRQMASDPWIQYMGPSVAFHLFFCSVALQVSAWNSGNVMSEHIISASLSATFYCPPTLYDSPWRVAPMGPIGELSFARRFSILNNPCFMDTRRGRSISLAIAIPLSPFWSPKLSVGPTNAFRRMIQKDLVTLNYDPKIRAFASNPERITTHAKWISSAKPHYLFIRNVPLRAHPRIDCNYGQCPKLINVARKFNAGI